MASKYPLTYGADTSSNKDDLRLCEEDQRHPGSCRPSKSCQDLHMCRKYILERKCPQFEHEGTCAHSHSLFTLHNKKIVEKRFRLPIENEEIFEEIAELLRKSNLASSKKSSDTSFRSRFIDDQEQTFPTTVGRGSSILSSNNTPLGPAYSMGNPVSLPKTQSPKTETKNGSSLGRLSSIGANMFQSFKDFPSGLKKTISLHSADSQSTGQDRSKTKGKTAASKGSPPSYKQELEKKSTIIDSSSPFDDDDKPHHTYHLTPGSSASNHTTKSSGDYIRQTTDESNGLVESGTQITYLFDEYFEPKQLSYLHGPIRRRLTEIEKYQVLSSGYYRLMNYKQEKEIKDKINRMLTTDLQVDYVQPLNEELALYSSTSAAERLFEQNQGEYAIMSEPCTVSLTIEIINETPSVHRSRSHSSERVLSSRSSMASDKSHMPPSDDKYHIPNTGSSIAVISGDISRIRVDMMVCVTTSKTILNSVLSRAGPSTEDLYSRSREKRNFLVLPGGSTLAKNILFVPWVLDVRSMDPTNAQRSLSSLVKSCIGEAHRLQMTSISFPSIGTGELGLDVKKVCQAMFQGAIDCLGQFSMDVLFVIYPSAGLQDDRNPEIVFRDYLHELREQSKTVSAGVSRRTQLTKSISLAVERSETISRTAQGKRLSTVSDVSNMTQYHRAIIGSLKQLTTNKVFDLSLIQKQFRDQPASLIDVCLKYNVLPRVDLSKDELSLRGDVHSCVQCFANLRGPRPICKYSHDPPTDTPSKEMQLNTFMSLKIDEARDSGETDILIGDDNNTDFRIDLNKLEIHFSSHGPAVQLFPTALNANSRIIPPRSWSSSLSSIRTQEISRSIFSALEFVPAFHQTMPKSEWHIERIDSIENWPLYVHFAQTKKKINSLAFHGCSFSSVQSIVHYGLHAKAGNQFRNSIQITRGAMDSHINNSRRSTDGRYYMFAVQLEESTLDREVIDLLHTEADKALPTHLIVYQRTKEVQ